MSQETLSPQPQDAEIPTTAIQNPALAEAMADAEKPYLELGAATTILGMKAEADEQARNADQAGITAGGLFIAAEQSHVYAKQARLDDDQDSVNAMRAQLYAGSGATKTATSKTAEENQKLTETVLTCEQQEKATKLATAMAEKYGVDAKDFSVVTVEAKNGEKTRTLLYTGKNGVDLGDPSQDFDTKRSWSSIFDEKNTQNFMVEVDGKQVDTRMGMTSGAYNAMIADAKARGIDPLPDSEKTGDIWTYTWLTGEQAGYVDAPVADVDGGQVNEIRGLRGRDYRDVRFRPAVVIE